MIAIKPYFEPVPATLTAVNLSKNKYKSKLNPKGDSLIQLVLNQQGNHDFDRKIYGATDVKTRLETVFNHKCAYCECNIRLGAHYDAEHFRAKKQYYWLGYEWTNLLLACQKCNRDYKGTQFPIVDERNRRIQPPFDKTNRFQKAACHIESLEDEGRLLLHPALDDPKIHLRFLKNGSIVGLTDKGVKSIEVYGLDRDELVKYRKHIIRKIRAFIVYPFKWRDDVSETEVKYRLEEVILTKILDKMDDSESTFIGFTTAIWENFDEFIIENTDKGLIMPYKPMMKRVFNELKQSLET
jgi:uncharacterized protein (TIGR02646 family)